MTDQYFTRDANRVPITGKGLVVTKAITYAASTTGATGATTLFTVTGTVLVTVFASCSSDLTSGGSATLEVGIADNTAAIVAQTVVTGIDSGEFWNDTTPATVLTLSTNAEKVVASDVIQTIGSTTVTGGTLTYYCLWLPLSTDGNVVAA